MYTFSVHIVHLLSIEVRLHLMISFSYGAVSIATSPRPWNRQDVVQYYEYLYLAVKIIVNSTNGATVLVVHSGMSNKRGHMLYTIIVILLVLWLLGLIVHIGGALIHVLLVVAIILFVYNLIVHGRAKL
jgi:hypothetical protein